MVRSPTTVGRAFRTAYSTRRPGLGQTVGVSAETLAHAAVGALESEPQDSAQPSGDVVHDGGRKLAGGCLQVGLAEGDQGSDVDD
jgi:hypothetical protein